jgi:transposase-like protein
VHGLLHIRQMPQHFLLSPAARTLTLASVARMSDEEAERVFMQLRWTNGEPHCPRCGCFGLYQQRRITGLLRWRCKACNYNFSITSGTLFASRKMPLRGYLMAIAIFANEVKGKSMLAMSRDLGTSYKTSFVLAHKMREGMSVEVRQTAIGGVGKRAEVDGGYFGGYVKPANRREDRKDRRLRRNRSGKRKVVVVIRERGGKTLPGVFRNEGDALHFIRQRVAPQTTLYADEAASWNALAARFTLHRINHEEAYSLQDEAQTHTNNAEGFFSRMRRGEIGHHHHVAGPYLLRFAQEAAWREDHKREANGTQVDRIVALAMANKPSIDFCGYWQRRRAA